ncbi:hypothetical protein F5J12DRAFT_906677 [Pisolithus orientalis]|uniref:uncharacterized protein n=1 Tax=Pisolithus orientalis TaxID=936130 RepID=UPI0022250E86|nr:uncharacterized protein F5J12DRAFT_906677 [Pisolithus orientalis]KAI5999784.1 hypothetical protein F5J12DRAFT_906677 [Pisolithus orientalis]
MAETGYILPELAHISEVLNPGRNKPNTFEQFHDGPLKQEREINVYYPFQSQAEWSLAKFLMENLTQTQIKRFLTLPWSHDNPQPSFTSVEELLGWMDTLPSGPKWQSTVLEVEGYKTTDSIQLIWHDAEEVARSLSGNPIFGADMMFDPILITNALGWEYGEWFSACEAHHIQDSLLEGATIIPILATSDKTPVTRMTRGLEMHPLLISISNIPGNIHMAATSHSWQCVMLMPIPKFDVPKGIQTILQMHIWHKCVDIVTMGLKLTHKQFSDSHSHSSCTVTREAKTIQLSNPSIFLLPKILHTCHKFFFNHLLEDDLNVRFKHFAGEHHNIQCTIVPMITGCVPPHFIYQAQSPIHTDLSMKEMESSLQEFHANARKTRSTGTKNDFHILKLELFHSFAAAIRNNDISECLLITHCKHPFKCTNKNKDFAEQQFDVYSLICLSNIPLINAVSMEEEEITATDPTFTWVEHVLPEEQWQLHGPHPVHNYFADGILANHTQTALHVTSHLDETNLSLNNITEQYQLPYSQDHYLEFLQSHSLDLQFDICTFNHIAVWHKLHVQLHSTFHDSMILPSQVVQALHPSQDFLYGCYDILSHVETPPYLNHPLVYLQPFCVIATLQQQPELQMWTLERCFSHTEEGREMREGLVVPITWISHAPELVPVFGSEKVPPSISSTTSQELYHHLFLNHFTDKEIFNTFHRGGLILLVILMG